MLLQFLALALVLTAAATVIALISLWSTKPAPAGGASPQHLERATVESATRVDCRAPGRFECARVSVRLRSGPDKGGLAAFTIGETRADQRLSVGDRIRVYRLELPEGAQLGGRPIDEYGFSDYERHRPLAILALVFCGLVIAAGRWRGFRALLGLGLSLLIVIEFIVPSILDGNSAVGVALAGALAVMFVTIPLAHGLGAKAFAAMLGTASSLALTALLATFASDAAHLTGLASDEATYLQALTGDISLHGLLVAGMIIGALGVLDDLTVTQASTVLALRNANPQLTGGQLFRRALDVGHDHIAATVNTLVLAYAGASLPVLLVFSIGGTPFLDAINTEAVAAQIVAMIVGSIGLIAAVPVTTAIAALIADRLPPAALAHAHQH